MFVGLGGGLFALEEPDSFFNQAQKNLGADLHLVRRDHGFIYSGRQHLVADLFCERTLVFLEKTSFSGDGFDDAQALQLRVSLGHGVTIDAQLLGQRTNGRERFPRPQGPGRGGVTDLIDQLEINRFAGLEINVKQHC